MIPDTWKAEAGGLKVGDKEGYYFKKRGGGGRRGQERCEVGELGYNLRNNNNIS